MLPELLRVLSQGRRCSRDYLREVHTCIDIYPY